MNKNKVKIIRTILIVIKRKDHSKDMRIVNIDLTESPMLSIAEELEKQGFDTSELFWKDITNHIDKKEGYIFNYERWHF